MAFPKIGREELFRFFTLTLADLAFVDFCHKARGGCGRAYADVRGVDTQLRKQTILRMSDPRHAMAIRAARSNVAGRLAQVKKEIADCGCRDTAKQVVGEVGSPLAGGAEARERVARLHVEKVTRTPRS